MKRDIKITAKIMSQRDVVFYDRNWMSNGVFMIKKNLLFNSALFSNKKTIKAAFPRLLRISYKPVNFSTHINEIRSAGSGTTFEKYRKTKLQMISEEGYVVSVFVNEKGQTVGFNSLYINFFEINDLVVKNIKGDSVVVAVNSLDNIDFMIMSVTGFDLESVMSEIK